MAPFVVVSGARGSGASELVRNIREWFAEDFTVKVVRALAAAMPSTGETLVVVYVGPNTEGVVESGGLWLHVAGKTKPVPEGAIRICARTPEHALRALVTALVLRAVSGHIYATGKHLRELALLQVPDVLLRLTRDEQPIVAEMLAELLLGPAKIGAPGQAVND